MSMNSLPPVFITAHDYERLSHLAFAAANDAPEVSAFLNGELARATVISADTVSPAIVRMGSDVTFRDESTGKLRRVTLVYPEDADISAGRISVMTPVGAALVGIAEGDSIEWQTRSGGTRVLSVLHIA